ncbi:MAG: CPBP family intramembrane metalloprotease [Chlamydiae bacterium]|nr:CPBP family intramembrane metalloprotease [Chlamydiota bacterium]
MSDQTADLAKSLLWDITFFVMAMLILFSIAFFLGFFNVKKTKKPIRIKFKNVLVVFLIYISTPFFCQIFKPILHNLNYNAFVSTYNLLVASLTLFFLYLYLKAIDRSLAKSIFKSSNSSLFSDIWVGIIFGSLAFFITTYFSKILDLLIAILLKIEHTPQQEVIHLLQSGLDNQLFLILSLFLIIVLAPIIEELLFRGFLQNFLVRFFNKTWSIIVTSLFFSLFHFTISQSYGNITIIGSLFLLSLILGLVYEKQKSLLSSIILHASFNGITIVHLIFFKGFYG